VGPSIDVLVLMKRKFVSLPLKIMGILMAFLLFSSISLTFLWIDKNNQDYQIQQQQLREQDQKQFQLIRDLLRNRLESWFESLAHFQANYGKNIEATGFFLENEFDYLQFNWQIKDLSLFDNKGGLIFSSYEHVPDFVQQDVRAVIGEQTSLSSIRCIDECQQLFSMPILSNSGELAVLSVSSSLLEVMAALNRSTFANLAIVSAKMDDLEASSMNDVVIQAPISNGNRNFVSTLLLQIPEDVQIKTVLQNGYRLDTPDNAYLLNLLPLDAHLGHQIYMVFIHNISKVALAHKGYQTKVLLSSGIVVVLCALACLLLTHRLRRRLLALASHLPLLAERKYAEFRQNDVVYGHFFVDELELLQNSASLLSNELESMDREIQQNTQELQHIAMFDRLSGLPNRNMLMQRLASMIKSLEDQSGMLTLMFLDFDNFRKVNDSHGHDVGNAFLIAAAKRIQGRVNTPDIVCHFGGDEFVIVLREKNGSARGVQMAESLLHIFRTPIAVGEQRFYSSVSIGITSTSNSNIQVEELIRQADMAMYATKDKGGDKLSKFNEQMYSVVMRKVEIEHEVRDALIKEEFSFALQPQVEISSGKLLGFEALIRWIHPQKGLVPPDEFIPVMENSQSMLDLGYWGLKRAFIILAKLDELGFSGQKIAVNLAAIQFLDPALLPFLEQQLADFGREAWQIELEITERTVVEDIEQTLKTMHQLKALGFTFSIDDFGTGYSSLAYLKQMPVDIIKIDRSFVSGMTENAADMQIVSSIIAMVHKLGMKVVAEGVETTEQLYSLNEMNCDIGQGYYISRPIFEKDLFPLMPEKLKAGIWDNLGNKKNQV
jgi:diguanylate cyclase (GGDEF)-like protein